MDHYSPAAYRRHGGERHGTLPEHMPSAHRRYAAWSEERFRREARALGPHTAALICAVLASRRHPDPPVKPEEGFRVCIGVLKLFRGANRERAEVACERALEIGALSYKSLVSILDNNLDRQPPLSTADGAPLDHPNIRGSRYYH